MKPPLTTDCDACLPECPWDAIYKEEDVPAIFKDDIPPSGAPKLVLDGKGGWRAWGELG